MSNIDLEKYHIVYLELKHKASYLHLLLCQQFFDTLYCVSDCNEQDSPEYDVRNETGVSLDSSVMTILQWVDDIIIILQSQHSSLQHNNSQ